MLCDFVAALEEEELDLKFVIFGWLLLKWCKVVFFAECITEKTKRTIQMCLLKWLGCICKDFKNWKNRSSHRCKNERERRWIFMTFDIFIKMERGWVIELTIEVSEG